MSILITYLVSKWLGIFLSLAAVGVGVLLAGYAGQMAYRLAVNAVEIYSRFQSARLDILTRRRLTADRLDPITGAVLELESRLADLQANRGERLALAGAARRLSNRAGQLMADPAVGQHRIRVQWVKQAADEHLGNLLDAGLR